MDQVEETMKTWKSFVAASTIVSTVLTPLGGQRLASGDACCSPCEYRLVCQTIVEEQPVTAYRLQTETVLEQRQIVTHKEGHIRIVEMPRHLVGDHGDLWRADRRSGC